MPRKPETAPRSFTAQKRILCYPSLSVLYRERVILMADEIQATEEILIPRDRQGPAGRIHVRLSKFRDRDYLDIRTSTRARTASGLPTRKGVAVPVDLYPDLMEALGRGEELIDKRAKAG